MFLLMSAAPPVYNMKRRDDILIYTALPAGPLCITIGVRAAGPHSVALAQGRLWQQAHDPTRPQANYAVCYANVATHSPSLHTTAKLPLSLTLGEQRLTPPTCCCPWRVERGTFAAVPCYLNNTYLQCQRLA